MPLLTLTAREEVVRGRHWVFRLRTRPAEEAELLAAYAVAHARRRRFAILYRDDAYGRGLRRPVLGRGRGARRRASSASPRYPPNPTDFADPIRRLVGYVLLDDEEKARSRERE